jgi:hypothetical protein
VIRNIGENEPSKRRKKATFRIIVLQRFPNYQYLALRMSESAEPSWLAGREFGTGDLLSVCETGAEHSKVNLHEPVTF